MFDQPIQLNKRVRKYEEEEYDSRRMAPPWTKSVINMETGTVLGRTGVQWLVCVCFYIVFLSGLMLLWIICYLVFQKTLTNEYPKWLLSQPGFSFEPAIGYEQINLKIEFDEKSESTIENLIDHINVALVKYGKVPKKYFGDCHNVNDYGYRERRPCFFLKINRIIGFKTEAIESITDLPPDAPQELRFYIKNLQPKERKNRIWVSCDSKPRLEFEYYPQRYYMTSNVYSAKFISHNSTVEFRDHEDQHFFNESDFKRIIAVQVENISINVTYRVHCILWAKNIHRDFEGKIGWGVIRFILQIKS